MNFDALGWRYIENEIGLIWTFKIEIGAVGTMNVNRGKGAGKIITFQDTR